MAPRSIRPDRGLLEERLVLRDREQLEALGTGTGHQLHVRPGTFSSAVRQLHRRGVELLPVVEVAPQRGSRATGGGGGGVSDPPCDVETRATVESLVSTRPKRTAVAPNPIMRARLASTRDLTALLARRDWRPHDNT